MTLSGTYDVTLSGTAQYKVDNYLIPTTSYSKPKLNYIIIDVGTRYRKYDEKDESSIIITDLAKS